MASVYTYPRIDELSLNNLIIISEAKRSQSRGVVYSTKSTTLGEVVELVVDTLAVRGFDESIKTAQIDIQTDLLNFKSRLGSIEERLNDTKIALEAGYKAYTDGLLTSYSTASATQQLIVEATEGLATAQSVIDLRSEIQNELGNYSTSTATQQLITTATEDLATSQSIINLSSRIFDPITNTLSESFANSVMTTESTTDYASAGDVTKLNAQFSFDEGGNITGISSANVDIVRNAVAGDGYASAFDLETLRVTVEGEDGEGGLAATVQSIGEAQAGVPKIFNQDDVPSIDNPTNSVWYDTNDGNKAYILEESDIPTAPKQWVELTDERLGTLDDVVSATRSFIVDANGNVAGMKIGANDVDGGYISFLADSFRIYNGAATETPFEIINGTVKIKSANIGSISFGDIADPPTILTTTIIYADNAVGANASTTKGTRTHIAFYNDVWVDGDSVAGIAFDKIAGADGTSVTILGSFDTVNDLPTSGNTNGDGYLIGGSLYVWDGSAWIDVGNIQGPAGVNGTNGTNGSKTATGIVFYQSGSANIPSTPSASGVSYNFNTGSFTGLNSNWGTQSPEMTAGTASNKYWTSRFTVIESSPGSGTGTPSFATPVRAFAFDQVVTFNSLGSAGSTVIDGGRITTGTISADRISTTIARTSQIPDTSNFITTSTNISGGQIQTGLIKNSTYPHSIGHSGFSTAGMGIDLDNGSIHAEQFYINSDGTSNFKGSHSAGSVGSWTVDSSGALKDGSSEIVLDPSGNYAEVGSEKLVLSSENLPAILPSAAVSANFNLAAVTMPNPVFGNATIDTNYRKTASTGYQFLSEGTKRYKYFYPDFFGTVRGVSVSNNISYQSYTGGKFDYVIPYAAAPDSSPFIVFMGLQNGFGRDFGWSSLDSPGTDLGSGNLNFNTIPNIPGVAGISYELKVEYTFSFIADDSNGLAEILFTEEKVLASGTINKNLNEAIPNSQLLTPVANDIEYFGFKFEVPNNWSAGQISGSYTPMGSRVNIGTASRPGDISVAATYRYEITNIYIWANQVPQTYTDQYLLNSDSQPWAYTLFSANSYLASGPNLYESFTNVLFTGASAKTNIGLNGIQVRGGKGFVAFGDNVPGADNAVAQIWGNANIFGTVTSNSSQSFSDKNLKDNITPISNALDTILKLEPVSFSWKPDMRNIDLGTRYGFIAQDVKEVLPTIVKEGEHLTLEHNNIISINTAAIKELIEKIETLEQEIQILKNK